MILENMFKKNNSESGKRAQLIRPEVPDGLIKKCNMCKAAIYTEDVKAGNYICPKCHGYFRMNAYRRIEMITEPGTFEIWDTGLTSTNPLRYKGYEEKVRNLREKTGLDEAVITGSAYIGANKIAIAVCDGRFMMASMGYVVGEKITRAIEKATDMKIPIVIFCCSGGARMQEGIVSLMQMAKTSAALKRHSDAGQLYISVLTDPTTGGVTASFAMLGDIILAEPGALIGFAGPRVIEQTIGQKLPKGFQRSEFLLDHGFIDEVVKREDMKNTLRNILDIHRMGKPVMTQKKIRPINSQGTLTAWDKVQISRQKDRPVGLDYIDRIFTDFVELHGDRYFADDHAIVGGIALFKGTPVTVISQCKGHGTKNNVYRNFGMPSPEGYRKALRLMKQAEKFNRPVICFVDTPGAFCGLEAEERGQGEAIARNLFEMSTLKVPVFTLIIGEGGSGGALAMAVSNQVWMLENSVYSILSPEGYASILWKDSSLAKDAAKVMKMTSGDLMKMNIIDGIIAEPQKYTTDNMQEVTDDISNAIENFLYTYNDKKCEDITEDRYNRFRIM